MGDVWGMRGGVPNAISLVALDFIALDITQIGLRHADCLVVLRTSQASFTDYHGLEAGGGGWIGKGRDSTAVLVDAARSRGLACERAKRRSTANVSRLGTPGGEAVSAEAAGDVINDASRDWGLVAGTQQESRVGKVPTCLPALAGTRSGRVPTKGRPKGNDGATPVHPLHPVRIGDPSFPRNEGKANDGWSGLL